MFTDEQRWDTLGALGNELIKTPNLDRLAGESMVFERCYVTQPVCTPARASLLTGLWPHQTGCIANNIALPASSRCLPEMLPEGKYATAYHGKWHLGDEIFAQHGFKEWRSIDDGYRSYYASGRDRKTRSTYHHYLLDQGFAPKDGKAFGRGEVARLPEEHSKPAYLAREASRFIIENKANPFVLFVNFFEPHMPFTGPRDGQYPPEQVPLPVNFDAVPGPDSPLKARLFGSFYREKWNLRTEEDWRSLIAKYWGLCSQVDSHAGTILNVLEECGLAEDTIVVYTSDHGDMMGSHKLVAKCIMYEEAVRAPLLLKVPGIGGTRCLRHPVSQIDLVPTLLDLLGERVPDGLPGKSLRRMWVGTERPEDVFIQWNSGKGNNDFDSLLAAPELPRWLADMAAPSEIRAAIEASSRVIVTPDGWKFCLDSRGENELYDLNRDALEANNLARDPGQRERLRDLTGRIRKWCRETGDLGGDFS